MNIANRAARNITKMATGHLATVTILAVSGILIPRVLGLQAYGRYAAVLAVVAILRAVSTLGLPQVAVRFLPPLWRTDRDAALMLGSTMWTVRLGLAPVVGVIGFFWLGATVAAGQDLGILLALASLCALRSAQEATRILFLPIGHVGRMAGFALLHALLRLPVVIGTFLAWGLATTFVALAVLQALIWIGTSVTLHRVFPLTIKLFRWSALRPHLSFAAWSFVDSGSSMVHVQFSIYAVAVWSTDRNAGLIALGMHLYLLVRGLGVAVHRSLQPLLAEIEAAGEELRLRTWSERMMRYGVAATASLTGVWAVLGRPFLELVFGAEFLPAHRVVTILLGSLVTYFAAVTCSGLLYIRDQARAGSLTGLTHAATGMLGLFLVLTHSGGGQVPARIASVFLVAAGLFFITTYLTLGTRAGLWLPLRRSVFCALPALLAIPAAGWQAGLGPRLLALASFFGLYAWVATGLGLFSRHELTGIVRAYRSPKDPKETSPSP